MGCSNSKSAKGGGISAVEPTSSVMATAGDATCHPGGPGSTVHAVPSSARSVSPASDSQMPLFSESGVSSPANASAVDVVGSSYTPPPGGREGLPIFVTSLEEAVQSLSTDALEKTPEGRLRTTNVIILKNGDAYEGELENYLPEGLGVLRRTDGSEYEGQFTSGRACGKGLWKGTDGSQYEGEWSAGRASGAGKLLHSDGSTYEGEFAGDLKHGQGCERWADGTVYVGSFVRGDKTGEGKITFPGGAEYTGHFEADVIEGEGMYVWADGRTYKGPFHDGLMEGSFGVYTWPSGGTGNSCQAAIPQVSPVALSPSKKTLLVPPKTGPVAAPSCHVCRYEGPFSAGLKDGNGVLFMTDGRRIEGSFIANKLEGEAVLIMPSGVRRRGLWTKGAFVRWLEQVDKGALEVPEADDDADEEYQTSIFSNPSVYNPNVKEGRKQVVLKGGVFNAHI